MICNETDQPTNVINFFDLDKLPYRNSIITIGNFDGVHLGHQALIKRMIQQAQPGGNPVVVVTFFPNPAYYFHPTSDSFYLSSPQEKEARLCSLGVDAVLGFRFDRAFANLSPEDFLTGLKENLGLNVLVVGRDFALGKNRQGTLPVIESIGKELSFSVETIEPIRFSDQDISSTQIRRCLDAGDVACAKTLLGRYYSVSGKVVTGSDRGSKIGLPTANIAHWPEKKIPAVGVYATLVHLKDNVMQGITNVGFRPTFEHQEKPNIETFIFDFDGNIYGEEMRLDFVQKIRDEQKFSGVDALLAQIERDKITARKIFDDVEK